MVNYAVPWVGVPPAASRSDGLRCRGVVFWQCGRCGNQVVEVTRYNGSVVNAVSRGFLLIQFLCQQALLIEVFLFYMGM